MRFHSIAVPGYLVLALGALLMAGCIAEVSDSSEPDCDEEEGAIDGAEDDAEGISTASCTGEKTGEASAQFRIGGGGFGPGCQTPDCGIGY